MFDDLYEHFQVTLPYREAKPVIQTARNHMNSVLLDSQIKPTELRRRDFDLGPFVLKDIKYIVSIDVEYDQNDKPHIDLDTCLPTAPRYLTITLKYCRY